MLLAMSSPDGDAFLLLNDLPVDGRTTDFLGTCDAAARLAELVSYSRGQTPFVLAIDGRWGTGKSSLMRQLAEELKGKGNIEVVDFNAWTASGVDALTGLIKMVLGKLDKRLVRRTFRQLSSNGLLTGTVRLGLTVLAGIFRADRAVDQLWERMSVDARAREDARKLLSAAVKTWSDQGAGVPRRTIAVFVDDLDRCNEQTVVAICEVIKLYLDLPGMVFVLGCDLTVLSRLPVLNAQSPAHVRDYLEKIVQVSYQIPVPSGPQVEAMIAGYAAASKTDSLLTPATSSLIGRQSAGNPRRVKRLLNSFVAEYQLDPGWARLGSEGLMNAVILQHFYPDLYQQIIRDEGDTVERFIAYRAARDWMLRVGEEPEEQWLERLLGRFGYTKGTSIEVLDSRVPEAWRLLAGNDDCLALLCEFGDGAQRIHLQQRLRRRPLTTTPNRGEGFPASRFDGLRVLWLDDHPSNNETIINSLIARGAQIRTATTGAQALELLEPFRPNVVISDVGRAGEDVGFDDLKMLRAKGFTGLSYFFTAKISPELQTRAEAAGASGMTASSTMLMDWLATTVSAAQATGR